jgi:hypothetical protein
MLDIDRGPPADLLAAGVHDGVRAQFAGEQDNVGEGITLRQEVLDPMPCPTDVDLAARELASPPQDGRGRPAVCGSHRLEVGNWRIGRSPRLGRCG